MAESLRHWSTNFLAEPHDHRYIATPCAFPAGSPVLDSWIASMTPVLGQPLAYNTAMQFLKSAVQSGGAERAIAPPSAVSPISRLSGEQCLQAKHVCKFNVPEIFSRLPFLRGPDFTILHTGARGMGDPPLGGQPSRHMVQHGSTRLVASRTDPTASRNSAEPFGNWNRFLVGGAF